MFSGIYGHRKQIEILQKSIETGKIAHAYLFSGPSFVGKRTIARSFAYALLGVTDKGREVSFHPDLMEVGANDVIKIEEVRDLIYKLSLKPYQAQYKVAIIDNAESMTVDAQNALLKSLEEPKSHTVIILVTANPEKILRTISSRVQKIIFGPVNSLEFSDIITGGSETFIGGRPGLAKILAADPELISEMQQMLDDFRVVQGENLGEKLKLASDLAEHETVDLKRELDTWLLAAEEEFRKDPELMLVKKIRSIIQARKFLDQNANSKLLLTNLMLTVT